MDQEAAGWSTEDVKQLVQSLGQGPIEQFVREHAYLQQRALAGFSKRLPPDYPQRLARFLIQRAALSQQALQELIKNWRQHETALCDAIQALELPITLETLETLETLAPLIQQYGGRAVLFALLSDQRADTFDDPIAAIRQGLAQGKISPDARLPQPAQTPENASKTKERQATAANVSLAAPPRPSGGLASRVIQASAPKTIPEFLAALEAELQTLQTTEQAVAACAAQLAQPHISHDPQALQRVIDKLTITRQKVVDGLARFAALDNELLQKIRAETEQAEASGLAEGLTALLPPQTPPTIVDEARSRLQAHQDARTRLSNAIAQSTQRLAELQAMPGVIENLLSEIAALGGKTGKLAESLAKLKLPVGERTTSRQIEQALDQAQRLQARVISIRSAILQVWHDYLQRDCRDCEILLNQSFHLSADLPEIINIQTALQQARTLLETPLVPNPPVPLPFPPAEILACQQAMRHHYQRLSLALSTYDPQTALATLHTFENEGLGELLPQQLREIGAALVGAASLQEGYTGFVWRTGTTLLMTLESSAAEQFYQRFGFAAVATAIVASLRAGDFPAGLAFAEKDYLFYTGADIASVFNHQRTQELLSDACATYTFLPALPDCFKDTSSAVRLAACEFLQIAPQIKLPEPVRLQLSAALLEAARSAEERWQAGRLFIRALIDQGQSLNAYCIWRALAQEQAGLYTDPIGLETLYGLLWRLTLNTHTPGAQLAALCADSTLEGVSAYIPGITLALALGSLALARARHPGSTELAAHVLNTLHNHHHYPALSDALRVYISTRQSTTSDREDPDAQARQQAIQTTLIQLAGDLAAASHDIQLSHYRFAPTKQMRNQIDARLRPLLTALQQGDQPTGKLADEVEATDPAELARILINDEERIRRQEGRDLIKDDDLHKLRRDLENVLASLQKAAARHADLVALGLEPSAIGAYLSDGSDQAFEAQPDDPRANHQSWEDQESLQIELRRLLSEVPQARDLLQQALPDLSFDSI